MYIKIYYQKNRKKTTCGESYFFVAFTFKFASIYTTQNSGNVFISDVLSKSRALCISKEDVIKREISKRSNLNSSLFNFVQPINENSNRSFTSLRKNNFQRPQNISSAIASLNS